VRLRQASLGDLADASNVTPSAGVVKTRLKPPIGTEDVHVSTAEDRH
jgi:hypothetical protein